jgi:Na+-transporting NADH:ubiquinone oxidoreductase subunit C
VPESEPKKAPSNVQTIIFMVILSFSCALILSVLASALEEPKEIAKELDRSKQMMIAAKILDHNGYFLIRDKEGKSIPAKYEQGRLVPGTVQDIAVKDQLLDIYTKRIIPLLVNKEGQVKTFEEAHLIYNDYVSEYRKTGYYKEPLKLIYKILANPTGKENTKNEEPEGYVFPVNGFGLWDAIYGYLAIKPDGNTVIGTSWYDQKETPGLGANISEPYWQDLFPGKQIFQESPDGKTDFKTAPIGITVVRGKVAEVLGSSPKSKSAVDGMAGATLTGNGVTEAYRDVLAPYRPFLINLQSKHLKI